MRQDSMTQSWGGQSNIKLDFIKNELGEDSDLICEMLKTFKEVVLEFDQSLSRSVKLKSEKDLSLALHKIKPSIKMFELSELLEIVSETEKELSENKMISELLNLITVIQNHIPNVVKEVDQLIVSHK